MVNSSVADADTALWNQITPELQNGEELLWVGKPTPLRVVLANGELITSLVGVVVIGFVLFVFGNFRMPNFGSASTSSSITGLIPLIFLAVGLFTLGRPVYEFLMAGRTVYGLTNQRAIIIKPTLSGRKVQSYTESEGIERDDIANGKGDLVFHRERVVYRSRSGGRTRTRSRLRKIGFFGIPNVREVEAMMLKIFDTTESA